MYRELDKDAARAAPSEPAGYVIFTADDFGASPEVNAGVIRSYREGVLTATSLMVAAPACEAAALAARENPGLDVGLHLVVCKGRSVLEPERLSGIVDSEGRFVESPVAAGMRYFFSHKVRGRLRDECRAQIERHLELVGYLNHIDGHLNFHVHPVIADIIVELAVEYRVPCIRLPREPVMTTLSLARDNMARKMVEAIIFRALSKRMDRLMAARGLRSTDCLFGLHQSGNLDERYVLSVIAGLRGGLTEFYFHPAGSLETTRSMPMTEAQREVEILCGIPIKDALAARKLRPTNFAEVARKHHLT